MRGWEWEWSEQMREESTSVWWLTVDRRARFILGLEEMESTVSVNGVGRDFHIGQSSEEAPQWSCGSVMVPHVAGRCRSLTASTLTGIQESGLELTAHAVAAFMSGRFSAHALSSVTFQSLVWIAPRTFPTHSTRLGKQWKSRPTVGYGRPGVRV